MPEGLPISKVMTFLSAVGDCSQVNLILQGNPWGSRALLSIG
jgi:hypothetical protein